MLATVLSALAAASLALADEARDGAPLVQIPNETEADSAPDAHHQLATAESVEPAPDHPKPHSEPNALDHIPAGEPLPTLVPVEAGTSPEKGTPGRTLAAERGTPIPAKVESGSEQNAYGRLTAGESVEPAPDHPEPQHSEPDARNRTPAGELVASIRDPAEVDAELRAALEEPVESSLQELGTGHEPGTLGRPRTHEPIKPIPDEIEVDPEKVALGRALFHDPRLSKDNTTACVSCHDLVNGGDDGRKVSIGVEGKPGTINAPTVFNAGLNFKQFWDGRANTLEQQVDGPVQSAVELGSLWPEVIAKLHMHESYPKRFKAIYPDGINRKNVKNALAEFMKSLTTPNSRFDQWLRGDEDAMSAQEKRGYALFKHYGCASCHQGANVGGNMFQVFGVLNEYFRKRGNITDADLGRYNITGNPADRHAFKVPSLRMAPLTAPYLHDGSAATLRDAVDAMFEFQLGREAPDEDKEAIVAFIKTLPGDNRELFP